MANDVKLRITADNNTTRAFSQVKSDISGMGRSVVGLTAQLGALVGIGGMGLLIKKTIDAGDQIQKLSIRLGASTEALSQYRHVAELSGVSFETLTMGLQRMTRRVAEAAQGTGEAKNALGELNIDAVELAKLKPEQQFEVLADALAGLGSDADRVRLSMKLFDSEGVSLLQTMTDGSAGIRKMREEADELGLTMSREQADSMAAFNDSLTRMKSKLSGLAQQNLPAVFDTLASVAGYINDVAAPAFKFLAEKIGLVDLSLTDLTRDETLARIGLVTEQIKSVEAKIGFMRVAKGPFTEGFSAGIDQSNEKLVTLRESLSSLQQTLADIDQRNSDKEAGGAFPKVEVDQIPNFLTGKTPDQMQEDYDLAVSMGDDLVAIHNTQLEQQAQNEQRVTEQIRNMKMSLAQQGIGFLKLLFDGNKTAQKLILVAEKGLAIAQTKIQTEVAAMRALAELGPIAGPPAAATIRTIGAASIGLIAATGIAQLGGASGGGSGIGGVPATDTAGGLPVAPPTVADQAASGGTTGTINVFVNGVLTQDIVDNTLIPAIKDGIDNRDVILIGPSSRNTQEILATL